MTTPRRHGPRVTTLAALTLLVAAGPLTHADRAPTASPTAFVSSAGTPTTVRIATFNMLGYSHTEPGGGRKGWADGLKRTVWATRIMRANDLQVVGLQEFQVPQFHKFVDLVGSSYDVYPGVSMGGVPVQNSLVWRKDLYTEVEQHTMKIPYFRGVMTPMPYVLLRSVATGQEFWVYNSHNPADSAGNARKYRARAVAQEVALVNRLEAAYPGVPVLDVGDKNDRTPYLCPIMRGTDLRSASGGSLTNEVCAVPRPMYADWITGSSGVTFAGYRALYTPRVRKTTDHHVLFADATLNAGSAAAVPKHVVVIDVQGLRGPTLASSSSPMPTLRRMMREGSATTEARTAYETVSSVPNVLGMLTSRRADAARSASSGTADTDLPSAFDSVHDAGLRTGFWTSDRRMWRVVSSAWDVTRGAPDVTGPDNGRGKISVEARTQTDRDAMDRLVADLRTNGTAFSLVVLSAANKQALSHGGGSTQHTAALKAEDGYLAMLVRAVHRTPSLATSTTILVTSDHGAVASGRLRADRPAAYRIPVVAWGAGVARGKSLYSLNPQFVAPSRHRIAYHAERQPIRMAYLGNLVTRLLGTAAVQGGSLDPRRTLRVGKRH